MNQLPWYWTEYLPRTFAGLVLLFIGSGRRRTRIRLPLGHDVTLSFAGEDRTLAARIAELCSSTGMTVLYDDFEKAPLWGKDLAVHADTVYRKNARYCIVGVSQAYVRKTWTRHDQGDPRLGDRAG